MATIRAISARRRSVTSARSWLPFGESPMRTFRDDLRGSGDARSVACD